MRGGSVMREIGLMLSCRRFLFALFFGLGVACSGGNDSNIKPPGTLNQVCKPKQLCNNGLICVNAICVAGESVDGGMVADSGEGPLDMGLQMGCGRFELFRVIAREPANLAVFFSFKDCDGNAMPDYGASDFHFLEDGQSFPAAIAGPYRLNADRGIQYFHHVLVDLSVLDNVVPLIAALRKLIAESVKDGGPNFLAISAFDGRQLISSIIRFTNELGALNRAADSLMGFQPLGTETNLNGAVLEALGATENTVESAAAGVNRGSVILLTDGSDETGQVETASVSARISQSPLDFYAIAIGAAVEEIVLMSWGKSGFTAVDGFSDLEAALGGLGQDLSKQAAANYLLTYCSEQRNGDHEVTVQLPNVSGRLEFHYNADGFIDGCTATDVMNPCVSRMCGAVDGVVCGRCGELEVCNEAGLCTEAPQAPSVFGISIRPQNPKTLDELICEVTTPSVDPNGDQVNYSFRWDKNGMETGETDAALNWVRTEKHETWRCLVTPDDGVLQGETQVASVTVLNTAPTAATVTATPTMARTSDNLTCDLSLSAFDADSDPLTYRYRWQSGSNTQVGRVLSSTATTKNQRWTCFALANDGEVDGPAASSPLVRIENSPPSAPRVMISPISANHESELSCVVSTPSSDADGDSVHYRYEWTNGLAIQSGQTLRASLTSPADVWTCSVVPNDGTVSGPPGVANARIWDGCTALEFDGVDDYVDFGNHAGLRISGDLSIEFWMKTNDLSAGDLLRFGGDINSTIEGQNIVYRLGLDSSAGHVRFMHESGRGIAQSFVTGGSLIQVGQWHHLALVRNDLLKTYRLFVDGTPLPFTIYSSSASGGSLGQLSLGGVSASLVGDYYGGVIDELRIWNRMLSQQEIQANRRGPIDQALAQGLAGYWPLHSGTGTTALDVSGLGQDGVIHGASWSSASACDAP